MFVVIDERNRSPDERIARQYEWFSVLKVMQTVMENIQFILNYCEDGDKLMSTDNTE